MTAILLWSFSGSLFAFVIGQIANARHEETVKIREMKRHSFMRIQGLKRAYEETVLQYQLMDCDVLIAGRRAELARTEHDQAAQKKAEDDASRYFDLSSRTFDKMIDVERDISEAVAEASVAFSKTPNLSTLLMNAMDETAQPACDKSAGAAHSFDDLDLMLQGLREHLFETARKDVDKPLHALLVKLSDDDDVKGEPGRAMH